MKRLISLIIFIASIVLAIVFYAVIFSGFSYIWFNAVAIFCICIVTFLAGFGIFISGLIVEKE